jgi:ribonucleoside-diphosphate reductase beta chain
MKSVYNKNIVPTSERKMFLGPELNLQRFDTFKYKKFYDLYQEQKSAFWNPEEIDFSGEAAKIDTMTETEKWIFENNLMWQTATDSVLSRGINEITKYITLPELEAACSYWQFCEVLHSESYTHALKGLTKNPKDFFDSIIVNEEINKRSEEITTSFDSLLNVSDKNLKETIFKTILSTQIAEGLNFHVSFLFSFWFGKQGKAPQMAKIIRLINKDESIHVAITQNILKYWKNIPEEGFKEIIDSNKDTIYGMYENGVKWEKDWASYLFSKGSLIGFNETNVHGYIEWLANNRLSSLGYDKIFTCKKNPIGSWLLEYLDPTLAQSAPQEQNLTTYQMGSRNNTIDKNKLKNISL